MWFSQLSSPIFAKPVLHDQTGTIVGCTTNGMIYILEKFTGEILVQHKLSGEIFSSPLCVDGFIFVGCRDNYFYKIEIKKSSV